MQHSLLFSGDSIFLDQSSESVGKAFSVQFEKEVFVEHDPSKHCKNYPTSEYRDYRVSVCVTVCSFIADTMLNRRLSISTLHLKSGCLSTKLIFDGMMGSFY